MYERTTRYHTLVACQNIGMTGRYSRIAYARAGSLSEEAYAVRSDPMLVARHAATMAYSGLRRNVPALSLTYA
jgi:hypothetical protein